MSRNRLDKLLYDKLNRIEVEPPKDMWAKLDEELRAMRGATEQQSASAEQTPAPSRGVVIRRVNRVKIGWRYIAASLAFGTLIGVTIYKSEKIDKEYSADQFSYIELVPSYDAMIEQEPLPGSMATMPEELLVLEAGSEVRAKRAVQPERVEQRGEQVLHSMGETVNSELQMGAEEGALVAEAGSEAVGVTTKTKREPVEMNITKEQVEREQRLKRWTERRQSRDIITPLSLSLFAGNTTGKRVDLEAAPGMMLTKTGFSVEESVVLYGKTPQEIMFVQSLSAKKLKHKFPVSFGISLSFKIAKRWAVQTGITYTYMQSEADIPSSNSQNSFEYLIKQKVHYMGVPLAIKYNIVESRKVYLYTAVGGALERSISAQRKYYTLSNNAVSDAYNDKMKVRGLQASVAASLGLEVRVDPRFGFYLEPGLAYYFENSHQPASYRTENPLNFRLDIGLRVHF